MSDIACISGSAKALPAKTLVDSVFRLVCRAFGLRDAELATSSKTCESTCPAVLLPGERNAGRQMTPSIARGARAFRSTITSMVGLAPDLVGRSNSFVTAGQAKVRRPGARILLADDLDLNRKLIADMLSLEGHETVSVDNGAAAVEAASAFAYDLILMDMIMPVMDGLEATRAIRILPPPRGDVPIVALTANAFREHLDACLDAGMNSIVTKPMSIDALIQAVDIWRRKDEMPS